MSLVIHYALNLFLLCANQNSHPLTETKFPVVVADSIDSLAVNISDDFQIFVRTPVYYKLGVPSTIVQLIEKLGVLGSKILIQSNIGWSRGVTTKPDIAKLKRTILHQYEKKKQKFEASIGASTSPNRCPVCKSADSHSGVWVYPCLCYQTSVPSFIERVQDNDPDRELFLTPQAFCCSHKVHLECLTRPDPSGLFQCPNCNQFRNSYIPAFSQDLREFESPLYLRAAENLNGRLLFESTGIQIPETLAFHIVVLEARAALRPEILHLDDVKVLYRNLFLTTVLLISKQRSVLTPGGNPLARIIQHCLEILSDQPKAKLSFRELASEVQISERRNLTFYRQVALFGYFMLDLCPDSMVDWDDLLSESTLAEIFQLNEVPSGELSFVKVIPLPNDWLELLLPPYSIDITDMSESNGLCLLTGQIISFDGVGGTENEVSLLEYIDGTFKNGPVLVLHITGSLATQVVFATREFSLILPAAAVWLDRMGVADIGLLQGRLLSLNRSLLAQLLDDFMSGKFHDLQQP